MRNQYTPKHRLRGVSGLAMNITSYLFCIVPVKRMNKDK